MEIINLFATLNSVFMIILKMCIEPCHLIIVYSSEWIEVLSHLNLVFLINTILATAKWSSFFLQLQLRLEAHTKFLLTDGRIVYLKIFSAAFSAKASMGLKVFLEWSKLVTCGHIHEVIFKLGCMKLAGAFI